MTLITFQITIRGENDPDIEDALEEVLRLIREGYTSGQGSNETGEFTFTTT
jgi:hypothetical protein